MSTPTLAPESPQTTPEAPKNKRRKVKAIAAAGTVLGIGAAVTLANWTDVQFAEGFFGIGHYQVVSSVDGVTFTDHDGTPVTDPDTGEVIDNGVATLTFNATNIVPEEQFAAGFWLRTDRETTYNGVVETLNVAQSSGSPADFDLSVVQIPAGTACSHTLDPSNIISTIVGNGDLTSGARNLNITLPNNDDALGDPVQLCFLVTAPEQSVLADAEDTSVTWAVQTTSADD